MKLSTVKKGLTEKVMMTVTTPACDENHQVERYSDTFTGKPTGTAAIKEETDVGWPGAGTTAYGQLNKDEMFACNFRDPVRNRVEYDANTSNETATYDYLFTNDPLTGGTHDQTWVPTLVDLNDTFPEVAYLVAEEDNTWNPHLDTLGAGFYQDVWGYVPLEGTDQSTHGNNNMQVGVINENGSTSIGVTFKVWQYTKSGRVCVVETNATIASASTHTFTFQPNQNQRGYFCWSLCSQETSSIIQITQITVSAKLVLSGSVFGHKYIEGLAQIGNSVEALRILGTAFMYSNRTADLYASGECAMAQVPPTTKWQDFLSYPKVTSVNGYSSFSAKKGIYGWVRPDDLNNFRFRTNYSSFDDSGALATFSYPVEPIDSFIVCFIKTGDTTNLNQMGKFYSFNDLEFLTNSKWMYLCKPEDDPELYAIALNAVKNLPQFHENPVHLAMLGGVISSIAGAITKYGPTVIDWAGKIKSFVDGFNPK